MVGAKEIESEGRRWEKRSPWTEVFWYEDVLPLPKSWIDLSWSNKI